MIVLSLARSGQIGLKCASPIYINETQPSLLVSGGLLSYQSVVEVSTTYKILYTRGKYSSIVLLAQNINLK
jgi:hypothetical protein